MAESGPGDQRQGGLVAWAALLLIAASALHFLGARIADPDLWQHVRYGDLICRQGSFPRTDAFSYTAYGQPVFDHEWVAQCAFAELFAAGGSAALVWFKLALASMTVLMIVDCARTLCRALVPGGRLHAATAAAVLVLALAVISPGMMFRPQLFTIALLAAQAALLARAEQRLRSSEAARSRISWELALQPLLLLAWANLHGGFLVGLAQLLLFVAVVLARTLAPGARAAGRLRLVRRELVWLAVIALAGVIAPLANPYGLDLYAYLGRTLRMHDEISEWFPVAPFSMDFARFKLLVLASAAAVAVLWRARRDPRVVGIAFFHAPWLALTAYAAFRHQRHTVLFAVVAAPLVMAIAERVGGALLVRRPTLRLRPPVVRAVAAGALLIASLQLFEFARDVRQNGFAIRFGRTDFPADAVAFLQSHGLSGNVAAPFEWGSYAIWKLGPESRVFIDGRFETVYPQRVIDDYFAFLHGEAGWQRLIEDYPTDIVIVQRWRDIHPRLFARDDLEYVYSDPAALVFVRRSPRTQAALDRLHLVANRADFAPPETVFP